MKILVIGAGGREHALVWKLRQSKKVKQIYCFPGNAGINLIAKNLGWQGKSTLGVYRELVKKNKIDLTIVGPEALVQANTVLAEQT